MDLPIPFEISNLRLLKCKDKVNNDNPLEPKDLQGNQMLFKSKVYQISDSFGNAYIGTEFIYLGNIRYKGTQQLEYVNVHFEIYLENSKQRVVKTDFSFQNVLNKSDLRMPVELKVESQDNYIFSYHFTFKESPFITGLSQERPITELTWQKKFRVIPYLPFEITPPRLCPWLAPNYFLEYPLKNICGENLNIKTIMFQVENPFEAIKITNSQKEEINLYNQENQNIIFKISVKPSMVHAYEALFKNITHHVEKTVNLGSLFLQWGTCGVYVGNTVPLKISSNDIAVEFYDNQIVHGIPRSYQLEQVQQTKIRVFSPTQKHLKMKIMFKEREMDAIKLLGANVQQFELSNSQRYADIILYFLPVLPGIQILKGIYFVNTMSKNALMFKNSLQILVLSNNDTENDLLIKEQMEQSKQELKLQNQDSNNISQTEQQQQPQQQQQEEMELI